MTVLVIYVVYRYFMGGGTLIKGPTTNNKPKQPRNEEGEFIDYTEIDEDN